MRLTCSIFPPFSRFEDENQCEPIDRHLFSLPPNPTEITKVVLCFICNGRDYLVNRPLNTVLQAYSCSADQLRFITVSIILFSFRDSGMVYRSSLLFLLLVTSVKFRINLLIGDVYANQASVTERAWGLSSRSPGHFGSRQQPACYHTRPVWSYVILCHSVSGSRLPVVPPPTA